MVSSLSLIVDSSTVILVFVEFSSIFRNSIFAFSGVRVWFIFILFLLFGTVGFFVWKTNGVAVGLREGRDEASVHGCDVTDAP